MLAASFQDAGAWYVAVVYGFVEAGTDFVGMEEAENRCMGHSGNLEAHSGTEVEARFEMAVEHFETDWGVRSGKEAVRSGTVEEHCGMEEDRSGIEEAAHSGTEAESQARLAGEIVEAAQTLDFEVDQNPVVAGGKGIAIVDKVVIAERKAEEKQNRRSFVVDLQMAFAAAAAAAGEDNPVNQHNYQDSGPSLGSGCLAPCHRACCLRC